MRIVAKIDRVIVRVDADAADVAEQSVRAETAAQTAAAVLPGEALLVERKRERGIDIEKKNTSDKRMKVVMQNACKYTQMRKTVCMTHVSRRKKLTQTENAKLNEKT